MHPSIQIASDRGQDVSEYAGRKGAGNFAGGFHCVENIATGVTRPHWMVVEGVSGGVEKLSCRLKAGTTKLLKSGLYPSEPR
jgi:hypothetical protein